MKRWVVFALLPLVACNRNNASAMKGRGEPSASGSVGGPAAPVPSAAPSHRAAAWFSGTWRGSYATVLHRMDLPTNHGGIPEWKADDGKAYVGPGSIDLGCTEDGTVTGSLHGALGEQELRGEADDQTLRARILPKSTPSFAGTLQVSRADAGAAGELHASTPDGHVARRGTVSLARAPR